MTTTTATLATDRQAQRAADHARYKAEAAARRDAERTKRQELTAARAAARRATRMANAERARRVRAQRAHDALMRRVFGLRRDFTSAPLEAEDGTAFVSIEIGDDPFAPSLFVLQRDPASARQIVIDSGTGEVVARGGSREAALRAFAKTLPGVVVMPSTAGDARRWRAAWRQEHGRRKARNAALAR